MAKEHPEVIFDSMRRDDDDKRIEQLVRDVHSDMSSMHEWIVKNRIWYERRYSRHERYSNDPWPGASDVWLPVDDLYINRVSPQYASWLLGGPRVARMSPLDGNSVEFAENADMVMEHILRGGGPHSMPDFIQQAMMAIDTTCMMGVSHVKTYYSYRTRIGSETVRRADLPGVLQLLVVVPGIRGEERDQLMLSRPDLNPPELVAVFGEPVNPMDVSTFNRHAKLIRELIQQGYDLDEDEPEDKQALDDIFDWIKSGTKEPAIATTRRIVVEDTPRIIHIPVEDLIFPQGTLLDFSRAERLTHRMYFAEHDLRAMARDERVDSEAVDRILNADASGSASIFGSDTGMLALERSQRAEDEEARDDLYEVWQIYSYEEDGRVPRLFRTTVCPFTGTVLKKIPLPEDHGQMPFSALPFEVHESELKSPRGIPEILNDISSHVSAWHRWLENHMMISTSTSIAVDPNALDNPNDIELWPGMTLQIDDPGRSMAPLPFPVADVPIERLEQFYMLWPERLVGVLDPQNMEQPNERPRTASEIGDIVQTRDVISSMRGTVWLDAWERPFGQVWDLYKQFGPRELFVSLTGEQPKFVTQADTRGRFRVRPAAAVGERDPVFRQQQTLALLNAGTQFQGTLDADPRFEVDLPGLFVHWAKQVDPILTQKFIVERTQEQQAQIMQGQQAESERLAQIRDIAQRMMENAPITLEESKLILREVAKLHPDKELGNILQMAEGARRQAESSRALLESQS